jgi:tyrosyl-tRNA synthetase
MARDVYVHAPTALAKTSALTRVRRDRRMGVAHSPAPALARSGTPTGWTGRAPGGDDVALMPDPSALLDDLDQRGLIQDTTDRAALEARLGQGPITLYYGCDPTAPSLHHGNLIGLIMLRRFQDAGHRPIALAGGATGMIGDPGGRSEERNLLDVETLGANVAAIKEQISRILGPEGRWKLVDNLSWTADVRLLDFLRDVGKHVTVNQMVARESVKARMQSEHGISYTEFSYMLLQAFDYDHLHQTEGCELQIGGSDQWGNILSGVDLIRRRRGESVHALCWPLLTAGDGSKIGKTTGARTWLDPELTSPYEFFQHFLAVPDDAVEQHLKMFTMVPVPEIESLVAEHAGDPSQRRAQRRLAHEVTALVHGQDEADRADTVSRGAFDADQNLDPALLQAQEDQVPTTRLARGDLPARAVELAARAGLVGSISAGARLARQGGLYVNELAQPEDRLVGPEDLIDGRWVLLRSG